MLKAIRRVAILMLAVVLSACNSAAPATVLPPTPIPTPVLPPTAIPPTPTAEPLRVRSANTIDLGDGRWIATHSFEVENQTLSVTLQAQWPVVEGVTTPQIEQFNLAAQKLVSDTLTGFQQEAPPPLPETNGNFCYVNYQVINASNGLLSILIDVSMYTGGAHPNTVHIPLNFDLNTGKVLTYDDVFKPGVDAVSTLSAIATDELTRTNRLMFPDGAEPRPENYQVWNFDLNNLIITFDQYQVMPYAAGPQTVAIPYYELKDDLKPASPLADFWNLTKR
jgi:hypothetical protein